MKKYRKNWGKLFQIRVSKEEHKKIIKFIKKFDATRREFLLTVLNELKNMEVLVDGGFYKSNQEHAYCYRAYWDKTITIDSKCEICGRPYIPENNMSESLVRHHHDGYVDENYKKTHILCRRCHGFCHRNVNKIKSFEEVVELGKKEF